MIIPGNITEPVVLTENMTQSNGTRSKERSFDQYLAAMDKRDAQSNDKNVKRVEPNAVRNKRADKAQPQKARNNKDTSNKINESNDESTTEATEQTTVVNTTAEANESTVPTNVVEDAEKAIISNIAEILQVPEETILLWLAQLNLTPLDLTEPKNVAALLQEAFGADSPVDLLSEPAFPQVFEAINEVAAAFAPLLEQAETTVSPFVVDGLHVQVDTAGEPVVTDVAHETVTDTETPVVFIEDEIDLFSENESATTEPEVKTTAPAAAPVAASDAATQSETGQTDTGDATGQEAGFQGVIIANAPTEQHGVRAMEQVRQPVSNDPVNATDVMNQIMSRVRTQSGDQFAELRITLRPENLGDVTLRVLTQNGVVTAQFVAENQRVKEVLESNFNQLRNALQEQGVQVSELSVTVGQNNDEEQARQFLRAQQGSRGRMRRIVRNLSEVGAETSESEDAADLTPSLVDITV